LRPPTVIATVADALVHRICSPAELRAARRRADVSSPISRRCRHRAGGGAARDSSRAGLCIARGEGTMKEMYHLRTVAVRRQFILVGMHYISRSLSLRGLTIYNDRPQEPLCATTTTQKAPDQARARARDGRPTPIIFSDVSDGHGHRMGNKSSFPQTTKQHRPRRCARRARAVLRHRRNYIFISS